MKNFSYFFLILLSVFPHVVQSATSHCDDVFSSPQPSGKIIAELKTYKEYVIQGFQLPPAYTEPFYQRRIEPYLNRPRYEGPAVPKSLFRGMYLNWDQMTEITEKGMTTEQVTWTAFVGQSLSFSSNTEEAASYIFKNADARPGGIGVVFKVRASKDMISLADPVHNTTKTIFSLNRNLKPNEIEDVYLWGEYGLESVRTILERAKSQKIKPQNQWTQF